MHSLAGYKILQEMNSLKDSIYVLNSNFTELDNHIVNLKEFSENTLKSNHNLETKRLIHNYLCSAVTLIDHNRIYINNTHKEKEFIDYQSKIDEIFIQNPLCHFIKEFRQYLQHFKLPDISFQSNALSIKRYWSIKINKEEILKFSGWKSGAKKFIKSQITDIDLHKVLTEYQNIVNKFYNWVLERQEEIFASEFEEVKKIRAKIKNTKREQIIENVIIQKYRNFESFEKEFYSIFEQNEMKYLKGLHLPHRIVKIIGILKVEKKMKEVFQGNLESLII